MLLSESAGGGDASEDDDGVAVKTLLTGLRADCFRISMRLWTWWKVRGATKVESGDAFFATLEEVIAVVVVGVYWDTACKYTSCKCSIDSSFMGETIEEVSFSFI